MGNALAQAFDDPGVVVGTTVPGVDIEVNEEFIARLLEVDLTFKTSPTQVSRTTCLS